MESRKGEKEKTKNSKNLQLRIFLRIQAFKIKKMKKLMKKMLLKISKLQTICLTFNSNQKINKISYRSKYLG